MYIIDNHYTVSEFFKLCHATLCTRLFYPGALLVRRPFYLRGKPRFQYGEGFTCGYGCRIEVFGAKDDVSKKLVIGKNCKLGDHVHIAASEKVTIGDDCLMASKVFISDNSHGRYAGDDSSIVSSPDTVPNERLISSSPVSIGDRVWIGENVCILKGVTIGSGVVIGANSVVTRSVPDDTIIAGAPARVIKRFDRSSGLWVAVSGVSTESR